MNVMLLPRLQALSFVRHYKQYGFDAISLMPTNLYGQGDNYHKNDSHVMAALIRKFYEAKLYNHKEVICWGSGNL